MCLKLLCILPAGYSEKIPFVKLAPIEAEEAAKGKKKAAGGKGASAKTEAGSKKERGDSDAVADSLGSVKLNWMVSVSLSFFSSTSRLLASPRCHWCQTSACHSAWVISWMWRSVIYCLWINILYSRRVVASSVECCLILAYWLENREKYYFYIRLPVMYRYSGGIVNLAYDWNHLSFTVKKTRPVKYLVNSDLELYSLTCHQGGFKIDVAVVTPLTLDGKIFVIAG